jgi:hypothetical protein
MRQKFYNKHGGAKTVQREVLNIIKEIDSLKGKPYADALTKYEKLMDN